MNRQQQLQRLKQMRESHLSTLKPVSSLRLQTLLYFDFWFCWIYILAELACFFFKSDFLNFPFPKSFTYEIRAMISLILMNFVKIKIGNLGNKSESSHFTTWFIMLCLGALIGFIFFLRYQVFVLQLEFILNGITCGFTAMELVGGILVLRKFKSTEKTLYLD